MGTCYRASGDCLVWVEVRFEPSAFLDYGSLCANMSRQHRIEPHDS